MDEALNKLADNRILDKRKGKLAHSEKRGIESETPPPSSAPRFVKPALPDREIEAQQLQDKDNGSHRPWSDRYGPVNLDELAVHKKKVADVQEWLDSALNGRIRQVCESRVV